MVFFPELNDLSCRSWLKGSLFPGPGIVFFEAHLEDPVFAAASGVLETAFGHIGRLELEDLGARAGTRPGLAKCIQSHLPVDFDSSSRA